MVASKDYGIASDCSQNFQVPYCFGTVHIESLLLDERSFSA